MKLTKKLQAEILKIYNTYWDAYLAGDMKTFASMLDDNIKVFGTAVSEVFNNKTETVRFYKATADQMTGKAEFRNRKIKMNPVEETVLIHEQSNLFVLIENEWIFYSPVRVSAIFVNTPKGWKLTHQHGSFPDSRAEAGEQIAPEKIRKENLELREAIKRRTVELENKNRELEIEASLEKVRTIAMGMRKPDDMLDVCKTISLQLQSLGVKEIRNVQTAIFYEQRGTYMNYEYYSMHDKTIITETVFTNNKIHNDFATKMMRGKGETFITHIKGSKVKDWIAYQKTTNVFIDKYLETASSLNYYWFSLGPVALGISTYQPLKEEEINLFKRFLKVFELAYQRYLDIEQAEAQTREAQIEASLERVRAVAMSMNKSDDLISICEVSYKEFQKLGFNSLRNAIIHIPNDENKYFMDYDFSDLTGGAITKIEYGSHPVVEDYLKQIKSAKNAFAQTVLKEDLLEEWKDFRRNSGQIDDPRLDKATALYYYFFSIGIGDTGISTLEPINESQIKILKRFRNVFDLAYRRYTDITRAEAQAREAQIELALERVRARTMAMQKSDELKEVVASMFDGMKSLGVDPTVCNIALVDRKTCDTDVWTAHQTDNGMITYKVFISHFEHPFRKKLLDSFLNEIPFSVHELSGDLKKSYVQYLFEHIDYSNVPAEVTKSNEELANMEDGIVLSAAYMKYGLLIVSRNHPISNDESDILQRFAKIFEQTYTRFLDLQKAESQAREAQIEAALERVRSRSMAMHKSEEFPEVIQVVFEQFRQLNFKVDSAQFDVSFRETDDLNLWTAVPGRPYPTRQHIPFTENAVFNSIKKAKEAGLDFVSNQFTVEEKTEFFEYFFKHVTNIPEERRKFILSSPGFFRSVVILDKVSLGIQNYSGIPYTDTEHAILKRFAKIFEQTYTRFLDLQKAEAQAREAQIEVALERVRSQSMGMQSSKDFSNVTTEMFNQLRQFGGDLFATGIVFCDKHDGHVEQWHSLPDAGMLSPFIVPVNLDYIHQYRYDQWKKGVELFEIEIPGDFIEQHFNDIFNLPTAQKVLKDFEDQHTPMPETPPWEIDYGASFKHGYILASSLQPFKEAEILPRFAKVFEQTYTRFLDLQKAEAQAKEAKIEASMEKIRSRSLAMQKPDELVEVAELLRKEMGLLGVEELETSSIYIVDEENQQAECWYAIKDIREENKRLVSDEMTLILSDTWVGNEMWKFYRSKKEQISIVMKGDNRKEWINYCAYKSKVLQGYYGDEIPERTYHLVKFNGGYMGAASPGDISSESWDLLKRAAAVFSLAYTRFKDLQDAEASAREAQIEAALERVRSRTMGMQKSVELKDVIRVVYEQFVHLKINVDHAGFVVDYAPKGDWHFWIADEQDIPSKITHPYFESVWANQFNEAKEKGADFFATNLNFEEKNKFYNELLSYVPGLPEASKDFYLSCPGLAAATVLFDNVSLYIENFSGIPYTDEENNMLMRFGKVFQQTYTRFLDLQKAEAQARESQIEASLERVRSKALAMHSPNDLSETVNVFFKELKILGIIPIRCGVGQIDKATRTTNLTTTTSSQQGESFQVIGKVKQTGHPVLDGIFDHWELQKEYHPVLEGDDIKAYYNVMNAQIGYPEYPEGVTQYGNSFFFKEGFVFAWTENLLSEDELIIFRRFTLVLSLTYRRYLDLKEAEERNKIIQAENDRKTKELEEARQLQLSMLPKKLPQLPNLDIAVYMKTATEVGGDYYDFNIQENGVLNIGFGDATGHGLQAGTMITLMKGFFTSDAARFGPPKFLENCNSLIRDIKLGRILMSFSHLRFENNSLLMSSAGMPPIYYHHKINNRTEEIIIQGLPLGALQSASYKLVEKQLNAGDTILLLTDGLPEQMNSHKVIFDYSRVLKYFDEIAANSPQDIINRLVEKADGWMNGQQQTDDITFVVIRIK